MRTWSLSADERIFNGSLALSAGDGCRLRRSGSSETDEALAHRDDHLFEPARLPAEHTTRSLVTAVLALRCGSGAGERAVK
jgi:hypothetical protein